MISGYILSGGIKSRGKTQHANDCTQTGLYIVTQANNDKYGFPDFPNGLMLVYNFDGGVIKQEYTEYSGRTWIRVCWYGNWQGWRQSS